jgi:hypothetical protein
MHKLSCPAYGNYQPPYEECICGDKKMNLIEEVKSVQASRTVKHSKVEPEQVALALAFLRGEVQANKMSQVLHKKGIISSRYNYYAWFLKMLRYAYDNGMISTSEEK